MTLCGKPLRAFPQSLEIAAAILTFPPPRRLLHSFRIQTQKGIVLSAFPEPFRLILRLEKAAPHTFAKSVRFGYLYTPHYDLPVSNQSTLM